MQFVCSTAAVSERQGGCKGIAGEGVYPAAINRKEVNHGNPIPFPTRRWPAWPGENGASGPAVRGSTFIVSGKLFPAGTFGSNPERFGPDSPGSIGAWICAGTFQYDLAEIAKGKAPHVISTQYYLLDDGSVLMSEGLEGGMTTTRVILGGAGKYAGARGTVVEKHGVSDNNTLIRLGPGVDLPAPNIVFGFNLV